MADEDFHDAHEGLHQVPTAQQPDKQKVSPAIEQELRNLSMTIQKSKVQQSRMENFSFEPMSLPPSQNASRRQSRANSPSRRNDGPTPPLTPAESKVREGKEAPQRPGANVRRDTDEQAPITPQKTPPVLAQGRDDAKPDSLPTSRPSSKPGSRSGTPPNSHQPGDPHDRYARIQAQARQAEPVDPSKFAVPASAEVSSKRQMSSSSSLSDSTKSALSPQGNYVKHGLFGGKRQHDDDKHHDSMSNLKRFFKVGGHKNHKENREREIEGDEPRKASRTGTSTPPQQQAANNVPFADDHGLENKYGKFGKVLGSGAGGSVRLMKRSSDGVTFAVKQFRARHAHESEKEYNKKVTAEFCIGSTLHHGNIIETMDIIHEKDAWFEVMEFAPFDLFAIVMSGKMSKGEVNCCTMQILAGMTYLHSMGLAHRDMKLDNVVVNEYGIMKLIDFGSAVVFRYPFENKVVKASGIVGSDPYLAPEVYDNAKYDPQAVDIWSFAIIYCCMTLRRFPWKAPRLSDQSFKLFMSAPSEGQPGQEDIRNKSVGDLSKDYSQSASDGRGNEQQQRSNDSESTVPAKSGQTSIRGPWRLLRLLPRETRHIVGRMLDTDPSQRATLDDIYADKWVSETPCCEQESMGEVIRAPGHEHILEPGGQSIGGK